MTLSQRLRISLSKIGRAAAAVNEYRGGSRYSYADGLPGAFPRGNPPERQLREARTRARSFGIQPEISALRGKEKGWDRGRVEGGG